MKGFPGIYLHVPFCRSKCAYCDFSSFAQKEPLMEPYADSVIKEISAAQDFTPSTIYIGGGTPSFLPANLLERIFNSLQKKYSIAPEMEITLEMNPAGGSAEYLKELRRLGINRLSIGVQSFSSEKLKKIGRDADPSDAYTSFDNARSAGFENISADIIYGAPGEGMGEVLSDIEKVVELNPEHISAYQLTYTEGTPIYEAKRRGEISPIDEEGEADIYGEVSRLLISKGYRHYEISNYSKAGMESLHNTGYWMGDDYRGFGSSAHSFIGGERFENIAKPETYIETVSRGGNPSKKIIEDDKERFANYLLMRLRLIGDEITFREIDTSFGGSFREKFKIPLHLLENQGLILVSQTGFQLTEKGLFLLNFILLEFIKVL
ncbi:MAG: radical SAM family heme chaperone HemW [Nitrospinota bacterium]|nr:radical SAM family heme chaperone HemW [Nitrospinota bacterium]